MEIDRRTVLKSLLISAFAPRIAQAGTQQAYVSCRIDGEDVASVACFNDSGREIFVTKLPSRGHDAVERPGHHEVVVFARRPGDWLLVIDTQSGHIRTSVSAARARQFCGHGVFSRDGALLYATENDVVSGQGLIGIYDVSNGYNRVGEFPSFGIGPHDVVLSPNGAEIILANGGLRTNSVTGSDFLAPGDAFPNLVRIEERTGRLIEMMELPRDLSKLSIRHIAATDDGTIAFGCQHQGDAGDLPPLVGLWNRSGKMQLLDSPELVLARMKNYIGSVCFNRDGTLLAATSPHGGQVMLWSMQDARYVRSVAKTDVCGVAPLGSGFLVTSGNSGVERIGLADGDTSQTVLLGFVWDNHLLELRS